MKTITHNSSKKEIPIKWSDITPKDDGRRALVREALPRREPKRPPFIHEGYIRYYGGDTIALLVIMNGKAVTMPAPWFEVVFK